MSYLKDSQIKISMILWKTCTNHTIGLLIRSVCHVWSIDRPLFNHGHVFSLIMMLRSPADRSHGSKLNIHTCSINGKRRMAGYVLYVRTTTLKVLQSIPFPSPIFQKKKKPLNVVIGEGWVPNLTYSNRNICHLFLDRDERVRSWIRGCNKILIVFRPRYKQIE